MVTINIIITKVSVDVNAKPENYCISASFRCRQTFHNISLHDSAFQIVDRGTRPFCNRLVHACDKIQRSYCYLHVYTVEGV